MDTKVLASYTAIVLSSLSVASMAAAPQKNNRIVGVTKSSTGHGITYGTSSDKDYLPWLKPTNDQEYGYSKSKPVEIGGFLEGRGNDWPAQYFSSLLGPNGEATTFERVGSCCAFQVKNPKITEAGIKVGFLDVFKVTIQGRDPVLIYVTLYAEGVISAPTGFTTRGKGA